MRKYTRTNKKKRGGNGGGNIGPIQGTSAGTYVANNYGTQDEQVARVNNNYSDTVAASSSFLTPPWNLTLGSSGLIPNLGQFMSGGKSKKRSKKQKKLTKKKGGFFYEVIKQAVVPFTLLAMSDGLTRKTIYGKRKKIN
jgi:hypothetical protein